MNSRIIAFMTIALLVVLSAPQAIPLQASDDDIAAANTPQQSNGVTQFHGFAQPWRLIDVAVAEPGRVAELMVREGDVVRKDDLLARLDDNVLQATLLVAIKRTAADGERESVRVRLNHAARRRDDIAALLEQSHASPIELESADVAVQEAEAALLAVQERIDVAEAEVARIRAELNRREVRTPIEGIVIELNRDAGEYAGVADPVIAKVAEIKRLRLRLNVPTSIASFLSRDEPISIEFPEIAQTAIGEVEFISPLTESESGTVRVDIRLDNATGKLRSGVLGVWTRRGVAMPTGTTPSRAGLLDTIHTNPIN